MVLHTIIPFVVFYKIKPFLILLLGLDLGLDHCNKKYNT